MIICNKKTPDTLPDARRLGRLTMCNRGDCTYQYYEIELSLSNDPFVTNLSGFIHSDPSFRELPT